MTHSSDAPGDDGLSPIEVKYSGYVRLRPIQDGRDGKLCVIEAEREVPFPIKRVYYINDLANCVSVRGRHAHRRLRQAIFCISGSVELTLEDGQKKQTLRMIRDHVGVLLEPGLWHSMHNFTSGCVLLVLASDYYDEADYLRDYDEWKQWLADGGPTP
jgi:hypothetical protein